MGGQFMACLVVRSYTQIPVVDFTTNYSPVATDVTILAILIMRLIKK